MSPNNGNAFHTEDQGQYWDLGHQRACSLSKKHVFLLIVYVCKGVMSIIPRFSSISEILGKKFSSREERPYG